jgi:hypothetical protein
MCRQPFFPSERVEYSQASCRYGAIATVLILSWICTTAAGAAQGSLQDAYKNAEQLAATPAGVEQAMAGYQAVIETHLANEALFDSALRQLARGYLDSGRGEEGIRFFANLGPKMLDAKRGNTFRDIMTQFSQKYPEQVRAAWDQMTASSRRDTSSSRRETRPAVAAPVQELSAAILQRSDADLRDKALARLQALLAAESPEGGQKQGLATLGSVLSAKFDRKPFRDLVLPLLQSKDPDIRALALRCLPGLDAGSSDLALVLPLSADPSPKVRMEVAPALITIGQGKEQEKIIPALTTLLRDPERSIVERTLRSLWGQYSSPEFDDLLIQLTKDRDYHHWVIYHALSTMRSKSPAVCRRLIEELSDPDWNNSGRAAWGLTYGVTDEAKSLVEEGLLKALPQETNDYTRENELRALRLVATEKSRPYLKSVVDSSLETDKFKQLARDVLAGLERKP